MFAVQKRGKQSWEQRNLILRLGNENLVIWKNGNEEKGRMRLIPDYPVVPEYQTSFPTPFVVEVFGKVIENQKERFSALTFAFESSDDQHKFLILTR